MYEPTLMVGVILGVFLGSLWCLVYRDFLRVATNERIVVLLCFFCSIGTTGSLRGISNRG